MDELGAALEAAGGLAAGPESAARLRTLLGEEMRRGAAELGLKRSGYEAPVTVAVAPAAAGLRAAAPVAAALRADPDAVVERAWLLVAALTGALVEVGGQGIVLAGALGPQHPAPQVPRHPPAARRAPTPSPSRPPAPPPTPSSSPSPSRVRSPGSTASAPARSRSPASFSRR